MMKMREDNDMVNRTNPLFVENETKLSCSIRQGTVYDEAKQDNDATYRLDVAYTKIKIKLS